MTALPANIDISQAKLPAAYEHAKAMLVQCEKIDECKDWANKAEALASYAKMADDDSLREMADRIQARAVRRMGELLKQFDGRPDNSKKQSEGDHTLLSQREAAQSAGISKHQQVQAVRVANIPSEQFEAAVESPKPPTVTALAEMGKKVPRTEKTEKSPATKTERLTAADYEFVYRSLDSDKDVKLSRAQKERVKCILVHMALNQLLSAIGDVSPETVGLGVWPNEAKEVGVDIVTAMEWLERFIRAVAAKPEDNEQNVDTPPTAPEPLVSTFRPTGKDVITLGRARALAEAKKLAQVHADKAKAAPIAPDIPDLPMFPDRRKAETT